MNKKRFLALALAFAMIAGAGVVGVNGKLAKAEEASPVDAEEVVGPTGEETAAEVAQAAQLEEMTAPETHYVSASGEDMGLYRATDGTTALAETEVLPEGTKIVSLRADASSADYSTATTAVASVAKNARVATVINMTATERFGTPIKQLNGKATMQIPRPAGTALADGQKIVVYAIGTDGKAKKCDTTFTDYSVTFETSTISTFVVTVQ